MQAFKQSHLCQIDCTNHDQVINSLQIKSKDLYYFWRNYQWLYNKYYSQKEQPHPTTKQHQEPTNSHRQLEEEIARLGTENRKFRIENESLKKQVQALSNSQSNYRVEQQFQRQIERLNAKCTNYEGIREKLSLQIENLKRAIKTKEEAESQLEHKYRREMNRQEATIVELQKSLDEQRARLMQGSNNSENFYQYQEKFRRESKKVQILMEKLEEKSQEIVQSEMEAARTDLLKQFPRLIAKFAEGDLSGLIVEELEQ